ncbi:MAG: V-type ATPase subunit [Dehalococcoidia bacterium]|nr:V-type ATPase subunit [Dehalococcoidia bacterium]
MLDPRNAYMSAYLKGEEPKLMTGTHIDRMSRATNVGDAVGIISETDIGTYLEGVNLRAFDDVEAALWEYLAGRIAHINAFKFIPADMRKVTRAFAIKYDVANVKSTVQGIVTGVKTPLVPLGTLHEDGFAGELKAAETIHDVADVLTRGRLSDLAPIVKAYDPSGGTRAKISLETSLESAYYHGMLRTSRIVQDGNVLATAYGLVIDLTNLGLVCRAVVESIGPAAADFLISGGHIIEEKTLRDVLPYKLSDIPRRIDAPQYRGVLEEISTAYDRTKSVTVIDEVIERQKYASLRDLLSPRVLSPLVVLWYLILKETEVRNLRLILKAINDGVAVEEVKRYLLI